MPDYVEKKHHSTLIQRRISWMDLTELGGYFYCRVYCSCIMCILYITVCLTEYLADSRKNFKLDLHNKFSEQEINDICVSENQ